MGSDAAVSAGLAAPAAYELAQGSLFLGALQPIPRDRSQTEMADEARAFPFSLDTVCAIGLTPTALYRTKPAQRA